MLAQMATFKADENQWAEVLRLFHDWKSTSSSSGVQDAAIYRNHNTGQCVVVAKVPDTRTLSTLSASPDVAKIQERAGQLNLPSFELFEAEVFS